MRRQIKLRREKLRLAALPCALLLTAVVAGRSITAVDSHSETAPEAVVAAASISESYTITAHHGCIAVFSEGAATPFMVTDIRLSGLREADRELIASGITVDDMSALLQLLEDFGS